MIKNPDVKRVTDQNRTCIIYDTCLIGALESIKRWTFSLCWDVILLRWLLNLNL